MLPFSLDIWNGHNAACLIGTTACRPEGTHQSESPGSQAPDRPHGASGVSVPTAGPGYTLDDGRRYPPPRRDTVSSARLLACATLCAWPPVIPFPRA